MRGGSCPRHEGSGSAVDIEAWSLLSPEPEAAQRFAEVRHRMHMGKEEDAVAPAAPAVPVVPATPHN